VLGGVAAATTNLFKMLTEGDPILVPPPDATKG
jgi:hypothetical protein